MDTKEREMTPQESVEVIGRMVRQAHETAHFTGRPFLWAGVSFVVTFLLMALLYRLWPERNWAWTMYLYVALHALIWYRSLPKDKGRPQTLAERVIGEVWRTGFFMIFTTILFGTISGKANNTGYIPPVILLHVATLIFTSCYTNDDRWGYYFAAFAAIGALSTIFNNDVPPMLTWQRSLYYALLFGITLLGTGWRWVYLAKHPERRQSMEVDTDDEKR